MQLAFSQRSTLQVPRHHQTGLVLLNTLGCPVDVTIGNEGLASVDKHGTALMMPLPHRTYCIAAQCPVMCAGRIMKKSVVKQELKTVSEVVNIYGPNYKYLLNKAFYSTNQVV